MRWIYAEALFMDDAATLDDLREAVATLEDTERTARRVLGGAHPLTKNVEGSLRFARAKLRAREAPPPPTRSAPNAASRLRNNEGRRKARADRGDQAGAAADPNAELKAEIAALEAQLTEKRHELSRRTGTPQDQAPPPPTGSFSIGTSSPPARGRAGRRIVRARRPPPRELGYTT